MLMEPRDNISGAEYTLEATLRVGPYEFTSGPLKLADSWVNKNANLGEVDGNVAKWLDDLARKAISRGTVATTKSKGKKQ